MSQKMHNGKKDITEIQSNLDDGLKLAKILFHSTTSPILFVDDQLTILKANTSWTRQLGWDETSSVGKQFSSFLRADQIQGFSDILHSLGRDEQFCRGDFQVRRSNEVTVCLEVTIQRLELSDHTIYVLYFEWPLEEGQCWSGPNEKREKNNQVSEPLDRALQSLEKAHNRYQRDLAYHIEVNLLPTLEKMSREPDLQIRNSYQEVLIRELSSLSERSTMEVDRDLLRLTPKEMEVCKYIQAGLSSKEIAEMMYSSFDTIQTHRKNIRRKMGLKGKKTPLCTFLRVEKRLPMEDRAPHV